MSRRIRRDLFSDSLALTNLPEIIEMDRKTGTLTATLDSLASLNHCPSNLRSRPKAIKRKKKASRSVLVNIDNKSRSTKLSKPGSAIINTEKLTACDSLSQLGKKSHSQVQGGGRDRLLQLSNAPIRKKAVRQREGERSAVGPLQHRPGFHRGGPQALVKSHKVRAKLRDIALGRKSKVERTGNGILSMFGVGTAGPVYAQGGGKRNLNGAHSRGTEGSGPSCNGLVDLMGRMTVKANSSGDGNKICGVVLPAVEFRKRSSKSLSEVSRTAKRLSQKKTPNKKAFTKIVEGQQKSDSLQFLSEAKPGVRPKRNETSNQLDKPSFQQVSASDKSGDIADPDEIAPMIVDKIPVQVRRSEAKVGEDHDSVSTLGVDVASREESRAFFQGGIPSEITMEAHKTADIYDGPWTTSPDLDAPTDNLQSRASVCSSAELFSTIQSSKDRLFFIAHQPEGTRHVRWFLVTADIQQTLVETSCGNPQQSGKYHVRFYARHPGDPYMLAENEARWWPELHNYSIDNTGTIHYGDRVLVDPSHVPDMKKVVAWSAVVDLTDPEVRLLGPFDFQDALLNSPDRTSAFRQYIPSKHWVDLAKACIARSIHPPDIAAASNGSTFSNRTIAVAGMVPVENSRGRLFDIGALSSQINQTQERVHPIPNDTFVPGVSSSATGEFELTEGKKQEGPTLDATNKRSNDDREESSDCPKDRKSMSSSTTETRATVLTRSQKRKEEQRNAEVNQQGREKSYVRPVVSASPRLDTSNSMEDSMCKDKSAMDMAEHPGARTSSRRRIPTQFFTPGCETSKSRNLSPSESEDDMDVDSPAEASPETSSHSQKDRAEKVTEEIKLSRELCSDRGSSKSKSELKTSPKHIHTTNQQRNTHAKMTETTWTARQISQLKEAQKRTKPTSNTFWDDIADLVDDKSATDCQERWFSLVKTPMPKLSKPSRTNHAANHHPVVPSSNMDDDIFNSTPMRDLSGLPSFDEVTLTDNGLLGKLDLETRLTGTNVDDELRFNGRNERASKFGYKTYVLGMKRAINKSKKTKARNNQRAAMKKAGAYNALSGSVRDDEVDLNALLTPGGTLKVKNHSSFEEDEFWDGDECDYDME